MVNAGVASGSAGRGDFHFGILKVRISSDLFTQSNSVNQLPLADPADSLQDQGDVVHHGIQEGTTEGLLYSGVFVESTKNGISKKGVFRS